MGEKVKGLPPRVVKPTSEARSTQWWSIVAQLHTYRSPNLTDTRTRVDRRQRRGALLLGLRARDAHPAEGDARYAVVGSDEQEGGQHPGARVQRRAAQDEAHHRGELQACQVPGPLVELARAEADDDGDGGAEEVRGCCDY